MLQRTALRAARGRPVTRARATITASPSVPFGCTAKCTANLQRRTFLNSRDSGSSYDTLNVERLSRERHDYDRTRFIFLASGSAAGLIAMGFTIWRIKTLMEEKPTKMDATGTSAGGSTQSDLAPRKVVVHDKDGREIVPTGNSTVPEFPRTVDLPVRLEVQSRPGSNTGGSGNSGNDATIDHNTIVTTLPAAGAAGDGPTTEYTLVGLGTRTVSFLGIQVYVVGFYIATADIAALQARLIKRVNPIATTLVPGEKTELRAELLDATVSEALWASLLADGIPARSLFRIIPVRDTDFPHLRDGFVRAIQARAPAILEKEKDEKKEGQPAVEFGESVREFRRAFNRGKAQKQRELLMVRAADGTLSVIFDDGRSTGRQLLGSVSDERLSRALWMNYLAGRKVASEPARQSIVDGVIEFVERPVGTVATQVV